MDPSGKLPLEIMAHCIALLSFEDRITSSHVSRTWRSIAVATPSIWTDIDLSSRQESAELMLGKALDRSANLPVDIRMQTMHPGVMRGCTFENQLNGHWHRIRSFLFLYPALSNRHELQPVAPVFTEPAPMLELFKHAGYQLHTNLFGGHSERLRRLHLGHTFFPPSCPGVSGVTELAFQVPQYKWDNRHDSVQSLPRLFTTFPHLCSIVIRGLQPWAIRALSALVPPRSLREVELRTTHRRCDLLGLYQTWNTERLEIAQLHMCTPLMNDLTAIVSHGPNLTVELFMETNIARIRSVDSQGRARSLTLHSRPCMDIPVASGIDNVLNRLASLTSLAISAAVLFILDPERLCFPQLKCLTLLFDQERTGWPWRYLEHEADFIRSLGIGSLILTMRCSDRNQPPTVEDVRILFAQGIALMVNPTRRLAIQVRGVSQNVADALDGELKDMGVDCDIGVLDQTYAPEV
ncbi:hypothetical protein AURDEDRAFT_131109 [Auricularia subglabra TFB-10046 SS5]|uniref:F-box domain-containing protein n=1 Tax=Auricularia subglabra (strain TFB-10046 / SS5) TaxID=717982 RepID=J0WRG2_AURST|nr:hypothetical protein AURDEDRAFT_131109 [Auricularia subglabra TFB-10046 SS5]